MSEYMGLILGQYEAKEEGFMPGGWDIFDFLVILSVFDVSKEFDKWSILSDGNPWLVSVF